ncbi:unnamed protein product, partial [Rotaria sp. Silwood1]
MGDLGAQYLGESLKQNSVLITLDVTGNEISVQG